MLDPDEQRRLLVRAQAGDEAAEDELLEDFRPYVNAICRDGCSRHPSDVDDAVQSTLVRMHLKIRLPDPRRPLAPYIAAVARNVCREITGRRRRDPESLSLETAEGSGKEPATGGDQDPSNTPVAHEAAKGLTDCITNLKPRSRLLIELVYLAGTPGTRLPEVWPDNLPVWRTPQSLSHWLKQAREALRRCLEAKGLAAMDLDENALCAFRDSRERRR